MTTLRAARRSGTRLRFLVLFVMLLALSAHLAFAFQRGGEPDRALAAFDALLVAALLLAASWHVRSVTRDRERQAAERLASEALTTPRNIPETAAATLSRLIGGGVGDAGLVALAAPEGGALEVLAASGYPVGWIDSAPSMPASALEREPELARSDVPHPWVEPLAGALGRRPWVASVPLLSGGEPIGLLLLAARRRGALRDRVLLASIGRHLAGGLDHAALYEAAYQHERDLEELDARRREFFSAMAHEIRTPLTSIQAFAELLVSERESREMAESPLLTSLGRAVERLGALINDLLNLGQVQEGHLEVSPRPVDVAETLRLAESVMRPAVMQREQSLCFELPEEPLLAIADRRHLEQVLLNLLSNANRHTPPGGSIAVRARACDRGVRIEVEDSGPGVEAADRRRIFEPYYRVRRPGVPEVPGSGLGLAVARRLAELQGGRIWVEDASGTGALFCLELPAAPRARAEAGPAPDALPVPRQADGQRASM